MKQTSNIQILRDVLLHSGDVQPDLIRDWLTDSDVNKTWQHHNWLFNNPNPLIAHLPTEFTDFCLRFLLTDTGTDGYYREAELGFSHQDKFFPPAHLKPPFLALLNRDEPNGLRLVHGVVNAGISRWKELMESGGSNGAHHPLPTKLNVNGQVCELWGDEKVYRWFRSYETVAAVIRVALMALEAWMEQQIENGRDANELFSIVLQDSQCVAVVGICLSVACAYPSACLDAVWPLLENSRIWRMDVKRLVQDRRYPDFWNDGMSGRLDGLHFARQLREQRPQREMDVRFLANQITYSDVTNRERLFELTSGFLNDLPFLSEEEQNDSTVKAELLRNVQAIDQAIRPENQQWQRVGSEMYLFVQLPGELGEEQQQIRNQMAEQGMHLKLWFWAQRKLGNELPTLDEVFIEELDSWSVEYALSLTQKLGDASTIEAWVFTLDPAINRAADPAGDLLACNAIVSVAVASLVEAIDEVEEIGAYDWCRSVVLAACRRGDYLDFVKEVYPLNALGVLVKASVEDIEVRSMLASFALRPNAEWSPQVIRALDRLWDSEMEFCWNICALILHAAYKPRLEFEWLHRQQGKERWKKRQQELFEQFIVCCENNEFMPLPRLFTNEQEWQEMWLEDDIYRSVLCSLQLQQVMYSVEAKTAVLQLAEDLFHWTLENNSIDESWRWNRRREKPWLKEAHEMVSWNDFWGRWLAHVSYYVNEEEWRDKFFQPMEAAWPDTLSLFTSWLDEINKTELASIETLKANSLAHWKLLANFILEKLRVMSPAEREWWAPYDDNSRLVAAMIFINSGVMDTKALLPKDSIVPSQCLSEIQEWVNLLGTTPYGCACFSIFLSNSASQLSPNLTLEWLEQIWNGTSDASKLASQNDNGNRVINLMRKIWKEHQSAITQNQNSLERLSRIVDILVSSGVPSAALLRAEMETSFGETL